MLLVTGATGYLGSVLAGLLAARGRPFRALVRDPAKAVLLPPGTEAAVGALGDPGVLDAALDGCDGVLHLAGLVGGTPEQIHAANVEGTRAVVAAAQRAGVARYVQVSSAAAVLDDAGVVSEEPRRPQVLTDPYSTAKAEADALVLGSGLAASIVLPTSVYGPSPAGPLSYNALLRGVVSGEVTEVVDATMGWVLAEDTAAGILLALDHGEPGRRYVLNGEVARFPGVLNRAAELLGSPRRVTALPAGSTLGPAASAFARRSEAYGRFPPVRMVDDGARALGFAPRGVEEGLALTAPWLRAHL
ncbi:NAD-dependent epimerase/dehydratase family protein [Pseudonocardia ailaonensis]|uniref:NAD-dependent epimerase/dehydratase family protein n=1 Tax=Pseudonocardia ailaonensis TaxID=367279 RepID=A0ABN2NI98_9PSEU